jgi:hypothetical protein
MARCFLWFDRQVVLSTLAVYLYLNLEVVEMVQMLTVSTFLSAHPIYKAHPRYCSLPVPGIGGSDTEAGRRHLAF